MAALTVRTAGIWPVLAIELSYPDSPTIQPQVISVEVDGSVAEYEAEKLNREFNCDGCFYRVRPVVVHFAD